MVLSPSSLTIAREPANIATLIDIQSRPSEPIPLQDSRIVCNLPAFLPLTLRRVLDFASEQLVDPHHHLRTISVHRPLASCNVNPADAMDYGQLLHVGVEDRQTTDAKGGQDRIRRPSRTFARGRSRTGKLGISHLANTTEWKGGKEVVNDPDRSRSRGRAEDRRRPEISRVDGEVARADRSTEGQRPEVVWTEVGGRTGGEPEAIGTESK
ncbi:hypothetical protein DFH06DRAFT_1145558 [Mycena polygramma]|nr:hypothetical protein DFH06DRAFT_1145558 [Mycena polygramma]